MTDIRSYIIENEDFASSAWSPNIYPHAPWFRISYIPFQPPSQLREEVAERTALWSPLAVRFSVFALRKRDSHTSSVSLCLSLLRPYILASQTFPRVEIKKVRRLLNVPGNLVDNEGRRGSQVSSLLINRSTSYTSDCELSQPSASKVQR